MLAVRLKNAGKRQGLREGEATMKTIMVWLAVSIFATAAQAQPHEVIVRPSVQYVEHDGTKLVGDLYLPKDRERAPVVVAAHGGGWQAGSRASYRYWGPYFAKNGIALFAINYRLSKPGAQTFPAAVYDVKAAVQFVRGNASELGIDPDRIAVMGDSAGAHLVSLVALAGDEAIFSGEYRNAPHAGLPATVRAVIGFYGVYDMHAQWHHDQLSRPQDQITEKFIGASPMVSRRAYFDASPMSYATNDKRERTGTRFLLIHGTNDDIVDPKTQGEVFLNALKQARFFARTIVVPGSGHFWASDPVEEPGSYGAQTAPQMLRFLQAAFQ
jgi:acetyl esterase/lipase